MAALASTLRIILHDRYWKEQHFRVVSSAEFLGAHTFNLGGWKALEERPDERDVAVAKEYVEKT